MKIIFLFLTILSTNCFGYFPSLESLLRNSNNVDVGNNSVIANLIITEIDPETNEPLANEDNQLNRVSVKFVVFNENEDRPRLTQVEYKSPEFKYAVLADYSEKSFKRLSGVIQNDEQVDAKAFYSVLAMLLNNDGSFMIDFLKNFNRDVKSNNEIINQRKVRLLGDYKRYLINKKNDPEGTFEHPFYPEAEEKQAKVKAILSEGFLNADPLVKRVKKNDKFIFAVDTDSLKITFDSEHRMKDFTVQTPLGKIQYVFGRFLLFGQVQFPEFIWKTDLTGRKFEIRPSSVKLIKDNFNWYKERLGRYQKAKKENNFSTPHYKPEFLL